MIIPGGTNKYQDIDNFTWKIDKNKREKNSSEKNEAYEIGFGRGKIINEMDQDKVMMCQKMLMPLEVEHDFVKNVLMTLNWDIQEAVKYIAKCQKRKKNDVKIGKSGDRIHFTKNKRDKGPQEKRYDKKEKNDKLPQEKKDKHPQNPSHKIVLKQKYEQGKRIQNIEERLVFYAKARIRVIIFLRGCPGSGRTFIAKKILNKSGIKNYETTIISADDYFYNNNEYKFSSQSLPAAHNWNKQILRQLMLEHKSPIFIDNIHLQVWEMKEAAELAIANNYIVETLEPNTPWRYNEEQLSLKSTHSVSPASIKRLLDRFEKNITGDELLKKLNLSYSNVPSHAYKNNMSSKKFKKLLSDKTDKKPRLPRADLRKGDDLNKIYKGIMDVPNAEQRIFMYAKSSICVMVFMRGCPGSGKSTLAKNLSEALDIKNTFEHVFSADDFFTNPVTGSYNYSHIDISKAHAWNRSLISKAVLEGRSPIFVDNTHIHMWEMLDNARTGIENGYIIETLEPNNPWKYNVRSLMKYNQHKVPFETIKSCVERFEHNITGAKIRDELIKKSHIKYIKPPVLSKIALNTPMSIDMFYIFQNRLSPVSITRDYNGVIYPETIFRKSTEAAPLVDLSADKHEPLNIADAQEKWSNLQDLIGLDLGPEKSNESSSEEESDEESDDGNSDVSSLIATLSMTSLNSDLSSLNIRPKPVNLIDWDNEEPLVEDESDIDHLLTMFPSVAKSDLQVVLELSKGDIDATIKSLLDSGVEISPDYLQAIITPSLDEEKCEKSPAKKRPKKKKQLSEKTKMLIKSIESNFRSEIPVSKYKEIKNINVKTDFDTISDDEPFTPDKPEFVQLKLDKQFILQLHEKFATLLNPTMINEKTIVEVPIELAKQLHAYTVESVYRDIEYEESLLDMLREEAIADNTPVMFNNDLLSGHFIDEKIDKTPSLLEIMDSEIAQRIADHERHPEQDKGTVASKLSLQLLTERFPTIDKSALPSLLAEMNNSLHEATSLFINAGHSPQILKPKSSKEELREMDYFEYCSPEEALIEAENHRAIAEKMYQQRRECISKAQTSSGHGNASTMQYYLQMVDWYKQLMEKANSLAAKAMLKGYEGATTLDLHTLSVAEATTVLDLFLDEHIRMLKESGRRKETLYIITGRGAHSLGGKPKIKYVTQQRLYGRSISFEEQNPGMLRITINKNHCLKLSSGNEV